MQIKNKDTYYEWINKIEDKIDLNNPFSEEIFLNEMDFIMVFY